jgi:hypothetical protein
MPLDTERPPILVRIVDVPFEGLDQPVVAPSRRDEPFRHPVDPLMMM